MLSVVASAGDVTGRPVAVEERITREWLSQNLTEI
jgi:hypothetical protein